MRRNFRARRLLGTVSSPLYQRLVLPRREPNRIRALRSLQRSEFWDLESLRQLQQTQLRELLSKASLTSPWYRELLRDLPPPDQFTLDDLRLLPILRKSDLQSQLDAITGDGNQIPGVHEAFSGGSTGTPIRLWQTPEYLDWTNAELVRDYLMCNGFGQGQRQAFIWGDARDADMRSTTSLRDIIANRLWVGGLVLSDDDGLGEIVEQLQAFRPKLVVGYVSSLLELARVITEPLPGLSAVQTSAESLTPERRSIIEEALGASVFDRYGAREVGNLAHECDAHDGLHLLMENNIVEVVDSDGAPLSEPGAEGDIVVTNLRNYATPLIRYKLGDVARLDSVGCVCGRTTPRLAAVLGRTSGVITSPGGKRLHGEFFTHLFYGAPVRQFRVEQLTARDLLVEVVPDVAYTDAVREDIVASILATGDAGFVVDWQTVELIEPSSSGKFHFTTSRLAVSGEQ